LTAIDRFVSNAELDSGAEQLSHLPGFPTERGELPDCQAADEEDAEPTPSGPSVGLSIAALTPDDCRWPIGDPLKDDFRFCCESKAPRGSYCLAHAALANYPRNERLGPSTTRRRREQLAPAT
jgi:hypothetical protein